jgi:peptidoglycan/xylan/chitin deacetylase (PgdA/CDA1 family)
MRFGAAAISTLILLTSPATAEACDKPGALDTSRVLSVKAGTTNGLGRPFPTMPLFPGEIVLTFDDGPAPGTTPQILDILARECVRATFFTIGKRAESNPDLVVRIRADGHTLGNHSYSHRDLNALPFEEAAEDVRRGYEAVEKAAGNTRPVHLFRFPQYRSTPELVSFVRSRNGIVAGPDISSEDWRGEPPEVAMARVKRLLDRRDRGMLSLHDNQKNTVALLPMIIAELRARRMRVVHLAAE